MAFKDFWVPTNTAQVAPLGANAVPALKYALGSIDSPFKESNTPEAPFLAVEASVIGLLDHAQLYTGSAEHPVSIPKIEFDGVEPLHIFYDGVRMHYCFPQSRPAFNGHPEFHLADELNPLTHEEKQAFGHNWSEMYRYVAQGLGLTMTVTDQPKAKKKNKAASKSAPEEVTVTTDRNAMERIAKRMVKTAKDGRSPFAALCQMISSAGELNSILSIKHHIRPSANEMARQLFLHAVDLLALSIKQAEKEGTVESDKIIALLKEDFSSRVLDLANHYNINYKIANNAAKTKHYFHSYSSIYASVEDAGVTFEQFEQVGRLYPQFPVASNKANASQSGIYPLSSDDDDIDDFLDDYSEMYYAQIEAYFKNELGITEDGQPIEDVAFKVTAKSLEKVLVVLHSLAHVQTPEQAEAKAYLKTMSLFLSTHEAFLTALSEDNKKELIALAAHKNAQEVEGLLVIKQRCQTSLDEAEATKKAEAKALKETVDRRRKVFTTARAAKHEQAQEDSTLGVSLVAGIFIGAGSFVLGLATLSSAIACFILAFIFVQLTFRAYAFIFPSVIVDHPELEPNFETDTSFDEDLTASATLEDDVEEAADEAQEDVPDAETTQSFTPSFAAQQSTLSAKHITSPSMSRNDKALTLTT